MSDKKLLVAYRIEGDVAKLMYASHPDTAERCSVEKPEEGMAVLIQDEYANDEVVAALVETLKMIKAGIITEFVVNMDNVEHAIEQAVRLAELLSTIAELATVELENEDGDDEAV